MNIAAGTDPNPQKATTATKPRVPFSEAEIQALKKILGSGLGGFARQGDIVELHKRIGEKFGKLPSELNELLDGRDDPTPRIEAVEVRLGRIETTLDSLEGALRIELAPALGDALRASLPQPPRRRRGTLVTALICGVIGLLAGSLWHGPLTSAAETSWGQVTAFYQDFSEN